MDIHPKVYTGMSIHDVVTIFAAVCISLPLVLTFFIWLFGRKGR